MTKARAQRILTAYEWIGVGLLILVVILSIRDFVGDLNEDLAEIEDLQRQVETLQMQAIAK